VVPVPVRLQPRLHVGVDGTFDVMILAPIPRPFLHTAALREIRGILIRTR
jgi:hypothetical protein